MLYLYVLIWLTVVIAFLYLYFRKQLSFFFSRGVKTLPAYPLIGNMGPIMQRKEHLADHIINLYTSFPEERFVGRFEFQTPILFLRDIDLIKQIVVKDFEHFIDHRSVVDDTMDSLFGRTLISLKGHEWKDMRSTLSPAFTSSKIRLMVPFMLEIGEQMISTLKQKIKDSGKEHLEVDVKDLTTRYANDVIASCAFGLKVDSHTEVDNQFYAMGKATTTMDYKEVLTFLGFILFPNFMKALKLNIYKDRTKNFFKNLVMSTMRNREDNNIIRPDMIQLLMDAKKGKLVYEEKTKEEPGFSAATESSDGKKRIYRGFDTASTAMSFLLHELAMNPDVQERLLQEIKELDAENGGKFDYSSIQQMKYLDMVISELLRLWPPALALDRLCLQEYNCGKPNADAANDFILPKGVSVYIPLLSFHRDPQYFPDPLKFDPERFSDENRHNIHPLAYMPFGLGPRNCIGSRFALCEMKVMAYQLLKHIEVSPGEKTCIPAELDREAIGIKMKGGHWVRLRIRDT